MRHKVEPAGSLLQLQKRATRASGLEDIDFWLARGEGRGGNHRMSQLLNVRGCLMITLGESVD